MKLHVHMGTQYMTLSRSTTTPSRPTTTPSRRMEDGLMHMHSVYDANASSDDAVASSRRWTYAHTLSVRRYRFVGKKDVCYDSKSTIDKSKAIVCLILVLVTSRPKVNEFIVAHFTMSS